MPSRLSSLLVRDGLVGVKRMEKAFQRQVIYGGSLDTILLEMNLVPEERLTQYLALASGLPPAARDEGSELHIEAVALLGKDLAAQFHAVPLSLEGEALRVLVCSPLEISALEDLADLLDRPLQPLITPEYQWHIVYAHAYNLDPPARFTTLARQLENEGVSAPVGRAKSVIVDEPAMSRAPEKPAFVSVDPMLTQPLVAPAVPAIAPATPVVAPVANTATTERMPATFDDAGRASKQTLPGLPPAPRAKSTTDPGLGIAHSRATTDHGMGTPRPPHRPSDGAPEPAPTSTFSNMPTIETARSRPKSVPPISKLRPPVAVDPTGHGPLAVVPALELLATAENRDTVFVTLLRAARARARYAGLLTVQGGAAIGRIALAEPGIDIVGIAKVLIPLDVASPFRTAVANQQPYVGSLISGDPGIDSMVLRLGGNMPPSALVLPIVLRDRVVAVIAAHRVHTEIKLSDVAELLPLAGAAADALGRLIVKHKSAGYRPPEEAPRVEIVGDAVDTKKLVKPDAEWSAPEDHRTPLPIATPAEPEITAEPPQAIDAVLDEIEQAKETVAEDAISDAVERSSETLAALMQRFPGKLRVDRFNVAGRPLRAAQYGGLLELVVRLGSIAAELLIDKMSSGQRDVRFYATVCAAELRPRNAVYALVDRLFDQDYGVRATAIEALAGYPVQDLTQALSRARRAVHSSDPETVAAATDALVVLGDVEAIGDLIAGLERSDRGADHARRALVALTAQDFGTSERKWRKWWEANKRRHRIEWLIEGLGHKEDAIREGAIKDLRRLTGEYFGYHHDLPRKEREAAAERWAVWWREIGQRRFVLPPEDERGRPTGVLPARRD